MKMNKIMNELIEIFISYHRTVTLKSLPGLPLDFVKLESGVAVFEVLIVSVSAAVVSTFLKIELWSSTETFWASWNPTQYSSISNLLNQFVLVTCH